MVGLVSAGSAGSLLLRGTVARVFGENLRWQRWYLAAFLLATVTYYVFVVSAGHFTSWHTWSVYYDNQAEGFRSGHLYVATPPHPRLLQVADPFNPVHRRLWSWDYSLYDGHLYLYWGLIPASLLAAIKASFQLTISVGDQVLVFAFLVARALLGSVLLLALARRLTPRPPAWATGLSLLVFVAANPTPFLLARGAIYEAALAGGAACMTAAFYCSFRCLFASTERSRQVWIGLTSLALGLAGACRASLLPATALVLATLVLARLHELRAETGRWLPVPLLRLLPAAALPHAALTVGHFVLNHLRFGSWSEYGAHYQLGVPFTIGPRFLLANLWNYALHPLYFSCEFPFLEVRWNATVLPDWLLYPEAYEPWEPLAGVLRALPFCWLLAVPLLVYAAGRLGAVTPPADIGERRRWRWFWCLLALGTSASSVPVLMLFVSSLRYQSEFAPGLLVMCSLAGWSLLRAPRSRWGQGLAALAYGTLALVSVLVGVAFGFTGYSQHFEVHNPELWSQLRQLLSVCPTP